MRTDSKLRPDGQAPARTAPAHMPDQTDSGRTQEGHRDVCVCVCVCVCVYNKLNIHLLCIISMIAL